MTIERERWFLRGLLWASFLACALFIIVPAFASPQALASRPREAAPCRITGLVYASEDLAQVDAADVQVPFDCPITLERFERRLVLTSPYWFVEIEIPTAGGWMRFAYTWGRAQAYIGPRAVPIVNGPKEAS